MVFGISRALGHILGNVLVLAGQGAVWDRVRPYTGGLNAILSIIIASVTLFFHDIQMLYRRMAADQEHIEATSHEILTLNKEMEALVMERTMSEMALGHRRRHQESPPRHRRLQQPSPQKNLPR